MLLEEREVGQRRPAEPWSEGRAAAEEDREAAEIAKWVTGKGVRKGGGGKGGSSKATAPVFNQRLSHFFDAAC